METQFSPGDAFIMTNVVGDPIVSDVFPLRFSLDEARVDEIDEIFVASASVGLILEISQVGVSFYGKQQQWIKALVGDKVGFLLDLEIAKIFY